MGFHHLSPPPPSELTGNGKRVCPAFAMLITVQVGSVGAVVPPFPESRSSSADGARRFRWALRASTSDPLLRTRPGAFVWGVGLTDKGRPLVINANPHSVDSHAGVGVRGPVSGVWSMPDLCDGLPSDTGVVTWLPGSLCPWVSEF